MVDTTDVISAECIHCRVRLDSLEKISRDHGMRLKALETTYMSKLDTVLASNGRIEKLLTDFLQGITPSAKL